MPPEAAPTPVATPTPAPTPAPTNLVDYTGPIEHVFVHPLVVYPELAFDGDAQSKGMDDYMTTVDEFRTMLEELYANDYVLMNVDKMYGEKTDENGNTTYGRLKFQLPEGKKPVIISTDDMNYYQYMRENGCNWKMVDVYKRQGANRPYFLLGGAVAGRNLGKTRPCADGMGCAWRARQLCFLPGRPRYRFTVAKGIMLQLFCNTFVILNSYNCRL